MSATTVTEEQAFAVLTVVKRCGRGNGRLCTSDLEVSLSSDGRALINFFRPEKTHVYARIGLPTPSGQAFYEAMFAPQTREKFRQGS